MNEVPDFYSQTSTDLQNDESIVLGGKKYDKFIKSHLDNYTFEDDKSKNIIALAKAMGDIKDFKNYIEYLISVNNSNLDNQIGDVKISEKLMDDLTQLAQIKNNLSELKVETQKNNIESTTRDFEFIGGRHGKYEFIKDSFEPMNESGSKFKVYVEYTRNKKLNKYINVDLDKGKYFIFEYNGHSKIDYYNSHGRHLGFEVIDHKFEKIRNTNLPNKRNNQIQQTEYDKGAEQTIYFDKLRLSLRLKFFRK